MSEQIEEIFVKYQDTFPTRKEEIKSFLIRHYKKSFIDQVIEKVERIDATERLEKAGFHPELSSWKNVYGNIIISSCEIIEEKKRRFDYKFSFVEEKLDDEKIEVVQEGLKESKELESKLLFDQAIDKIDEMLEYIRLDDDMVFNKRLYDRRKELIYNKKKFEDSMKNIEDLEQKVKKKEEDRDFQSIAALYREIIEISQSVKNFEILRKYRNNLNNIEKKIASIKKIKELEETLKERERNGQFEEASNTCEEILKITRIIREPSLTKKYMEIEQELQANLENLKREKENALESITKLEEQIKNDQEAKNYEEIIKKCDKIIILSKYLENSNLSERYENLRDITERKREILSQIIENENNMEKTTATEHYREAIALCEKNLDLSKKIERDDLFQKFSTLKETLEEKFKKIDIQKEQEESLLTEVRNLEQLLEKAHAKRDFTTSLDLCEKLLTISTSLEDDILKNKYLSIKETLILENEKLKARKEKEKQEQQHYYQKARELETIIEFNQEEVLPLIEQFSVGDVLGDISDDPNEILRELGKLLEEHRVEIKEEITNKVAIVSKSGKTLELDKELKVEQSNKEKEQSIYQVMSGLENPFDEYIEEAIITDIIPFNFEIQKIELNGEEVKDMPERVPKKEGLEINWQFNNIAPREKVELNYNLRRRVSRTIIFMLKDQLKIIKTHSNLEILDQEGFYEARLPFTNGFGRILEGVVLEDIIPLYYVHFIKDPIDTFPDETIIAEVGDLIKWNVGRTMKDEIRNFNYRLIELYRFEELKIEFDLLNKEALEALQRDDFKESYKKFVQIRNTIQDFI